ncbi:hypothetical protein F5Y18DRAFT_377917 [Xylariaceae sp. FL1019]|nr:hypothetical protein F5Y18DRAFT_377917 [Xylariaceae sp. FL1019]
MKIFHDTAALTAELNSRSPHPTTHPPASSSESPVCHLVIGTGTCGTIFTANEVSPVAIKVGRQKHSIHHDWCLLQRANETIAHCAALLKDTPHFHHIPNFPAHHCLLTPDEIKQLLPKQYHRRNYAYRMERIYSFSATTRQCLLGMFPSVDLPLEDTHDCLIRPYLGQQTASETPSNLQNLPLCLDDLKILGLDCNLLAKEMAVGLAILHWGIQIDATDVEFVLGASRAVEQSVSMWILDFDKAKTNKSIQDAEGLSNDGLAERLAGRMQGNDNYFPKPQLDKEIWNVFCDIYIDASKTILKGGEERIWELPSEVLRHFERLCIEWDEFKESADIFERA